MISRTLFVAAIFCGHGILLSAHAQTRRLPELRSCIASEMALIIKEQADNNKSDNENFEIGRKSGYDFVDYYKRAIWALDKPESEARELMLDAAERSQRFVKYVSHAQLTRDVKDCRISFSK